MKEVLFLQYPKCSTCQKAKRWLDEHNVRYKARHIAEENPTAEELGEWYRKSGLPLKRFFNTSGKNLKNRLSEMPEKEQLELLSENGMLVKRPLLVGEQVILTGFREKEWEEHLLKSGL